MTENKPYKSMPKSQILSPLSMGEYRFVYEKLKSNKTFSYIDEDSNINLVANCNNNNILSILKGKKSIYIDKYSKGVLIQVKFVELGLTFDFTYDVYDDCDLKMVNQMVYSNESVIINFLIKQSGTFSKAFHIGFELDSKLKERLDYIKNITYNLQYPRINEERQKESKGRSLEFQFDTLIIEEVIEVCDTLGKWKSEDDFQVYISFEENTTICIIGECKNYNFIKTHLSNKYSLVKESENIIHGIPLIKYDKGHLYFYNYDK